MRHREAATTQWKKENLLRKAQFLQGEDCSTVSEASQIWAIGFLSSLSFLRDPEGGVKAQGNLAHLDVQRDAGGEFWGGELASFIPPIHSTSVGLPRNNFELH